MAAEPDLVRVRAFVALAPWQVAKTMPECPHEYTVRAKYVAAGGTHDEFSWLVEQIYTTGWNGRWRHMRGKYLTCDEHQFWCMGWKPPETLIVNRALLSDPLARAYPCGELAACRAITKRGEPCRNMAEAPRKFCPIHNRHPWLSEPEFMRQLELFSREPEGDEIPKHGSKEDDQ